MFLPLKSKYSIPFHSLGFAATLNVNFPALFALWGGVLHWGLLPFSTACAELACGDPQQTVCALLPKISPFFCVGRNYKACQSMQLSGYEL